MLSSAVYIELQPRQSLSLPRATPTTLPQRVMIGAKTPRRELAPGTKYVLEDMSIQRKVLLDGRARGHCLNRFVALVQEVRGYAVDDFSEWRLRAKAGQGVELIHGGNAPHHIFESRLVRLVIRDVVDRRRASGTLFHHSRKPLDRNLFRIADVDHFTHGAIPVYQADESFDSIAHVAEAPGLLPIAVHKDRLVLQCSLHKVRQHHSIAPGLPRPDGIEQPHHDHRHRFLFPVRKLQKLLPRLRSRITTHPS